MRQTVILLHGLARTPRSMRSLGKTLLREGFEVANLGYSSRKTTIFAAADALEPQIASVSAQADAVHFVGHSMGGLVARAVLARPWRPRNVGHVVTLGTPHLGNEIVDRFRDIGLFKTFVGPAIGDLATARPDDWLGPLDYSLGSIAGDLPLNPLTYFLAPRPHDGTVSVAATRPEGVADHIVLPVDHTFMAQNARAQAQTVHFLRHGRFAR